MARLQLGWLLLPALVATAAPPAARPRVLGVSHAAFLSSDLARSRAFYEGLLGFPALEGERASDGSAPLLFLVGERQYVELRGGLTPAEDRLDHLALETDDVLAMQRFLSERWQGVSPRIARDPAGERSFQLSDPELHRLEFVQRDVDGPRSRAKPAAEAVSSRILHAGVIVTDLDAANSFYGELLGLKEIWRGARVGAAELSWTNMQVPDGQEYVEFMLYATPPAPDARGTQHHICLEVPDIERAKAWLQARPAAASYTRPLQINVGTNKKRQLNLYDPDGTRVELMEPVTVDGLPSPWSTVPPPRLRP